jgi:hypothetical protein
MVQWFEVKCKYTKQLENGNLKRVTEPYLVNAVSFTEAEARIHKEVGSFTSGEFTVTAIKKENITDIFSYDDSDVWYSGIVAYETADEDTGANKSVRHKMLVLAGSVKEADERFKDCLRDMLGTFEVKEIKETPIVDVYTNEEN